MTVPRPLNVLLLLSYGEQPPPWDELSALSDACRESPTGEAYFATTRNVSSLHPGADVAFYVDGPDHHFVLAAGVFEEFISIDSAEGRRLQRRHTLYGITSPSRMRGLIRLSQVALQPQSTLVDSLGGWLADGRRLSYDTLPQGHAGASVYYVKTGDPAGPSLGDRLRLSDAKVFELEDKYADTRKLMETARVQRDRDQVRSARTIGTLLDEEKVSGRARKLADVLRLSYQSVFPNLRLIPRSAYTLVTAYTESRSLVERLSKLNAERETVGGLRDAEQLAGAPGWFESRFGDDIGRLYYRRIGAGRDTRVLVLVSRKSRQGRDVDYLRSLKAADLLRL